MKMQIVVLLLLCGLISACDRRSDTSPVSAAAAAQGQSDYEEHLKRQQAQLEAYDKQTKQAEVQLQAQEDMQKRADALLVSQEQLIKRQQEDFVRFERILDTWERQQKQYQRYLDSLEKPQLTSLTVPSAPSADFFNVELAGLRFLSVDSGYDTQGFLRHFAQSPGFPELQCFEWGEYAEHYLEDWQASCTPFADYEALFVSPAFRSVERFVLRQPSLSAEQLEALQRLRPEMQFLLVRSSSEYVREE